MENSSGYADSQGYFTKEDVAEIGVNALLITSGNRVGEEAKEIIHRGGDESRNSPLQNAKARMQILRILGLVSTDYGSEIYAITKLGKLTVGQVLSNNPNYGLLRELFMSITTSTEIYEHNCSADFNCWLGLGVCYAFANLDYRISTNEMPLLTTYDINDIDDFILEAREKRANHRHFTINHPHYPKRQNGQPQNNVSNLTRTINQILRVCGIIENRISRQDDTNYYVCTEFGRSYSDIIKSKLKKLDLWTSTRFRKLNNIPRQREICLEAYNGILFRSGVDEKSKDSKIMFSPYQMLPETNVEWLLNGPIRSHPESANERISVINSQVSVRDLRLTTFYINAVTNTQKGPADDLSLYNSMIDEIKKSENIEIATQNICRAHKDDDKSVFYPFVHSLLRLAGLDCRGEVGRFDAYVEFNRHIIPVEIKSYTETPAYNAKGIRQAIENKIMCYNQTLENDLMYSSLVIGFSHPKNDSEVKVLIDNAYDKFNIKIIAIDLHCLVKMTLNVIGNNKSVDFSNILTQYGLIIE